MDIKREIRFSLKAAIKDLTGLEIVPKIECPLDEKNGDYASNIAMILWANKELRIKNPEWKNPLELAQKIVDYIIHNSKFMIHFDRIEAVAPGFINFWLSKEYLINELSLMLKKTPLRPFNSAQGFVGRRIMVEFTDPNPFKEFHIGHLYSNTVGESISRLLEAMGGNVKRANYQGDVGMHIAKSLYAILQISNLKSQISNLENKSAKEHAKFLGKYYAVGAKAYEENKNAKKEIEELNKKIYDKDPAIATLYEKGRQWSLEYFESMYKRLGTKFDFYYFESKVGSIGKELVLKHLKKSPPATQAEHREGVAGRGVFEESQGAVIFPGGKYGLHNRVFINSLGLPTYEAKELGLALRKYHDFNYDSSIVITGNEIIGYFKVLLAALSKINPDLAAKTKHLSHGMVRLPKGKMSSRTGNIITGEWLLDEAKKLLKSKYSEMTDDTLEKVAVGSVKYALLKSSIGHDIEFDFDECINIQGNSGPYLQYTFARTQSVLAKVKSLASRPPRLGEAGRSGQNSKFKVSFARSHLAKLESEEVAVLRALSRFPEIVEEAGEKFSPNLLCSYLFDLAQKFNLFYQKHKIIGSENQEFRFGLTNVTGIIIKKGLSLLGIQAPEKM